MLNPVIFKANDIRGIIAEQWDGEGAYALGRAYAEVMDEEKVVVSRDMRVSGPFVQEAFMRGVRDGGVSVVDAGLASTDGLWFASGFLDLPGVQITSSHNPPEYNGMKFCLRRALPVTPQFLLDLADKAMGYDQDGCPPPVNAGTYEQRDTLPDYVDYLTSLVDLNGIRRLRVVVDAGNGMGGHTAPAVFAGLNAELIGLYLDLDGNFPNHQPNPLEPQNLVDAQKAVRETGADLAIVFDGDADRAFIIDERGDVVSPSTITAMIAVSELAREPGATIVVNTITSSGVREIVEEHGGQVVESRVGHTYMKALMASRNAIFGGEHSAHYYFRDFFGADTGMLAGLHVLSALGHSDQPLSALTAQYSRYAGSGEINSTVHNAQACMDKVARELAAQGEVAWPDGLKVTGPNWWASLRSSNTEPLLRLNVEAATPARVEELVSVVLTLIGEESEKS
ncbi:MAG: phosphomannomutase/phosphoglucomutase [Propionibacteriaceae bacterium]|jgi:phosphomannomutase|nr:phosphomannomutase/phosphoglucomutase [Propionibacteriaceae bacterium]